MVLPRPSSLRGFAPARFLRSATPRTATRAIARRGYASSGGHGSAPSSDIPWLVGAVAVTIPSCWYLWPEPSHAGSHGAHGAHEEHAEESEEPEEEQPAEEEEAPKEEAPKEDESKDEPKEESKDEKKDESEQESKDEPKEEKKDDKPEDESKDESKDTESKPTPESKGDTKDVKFKGPTSEGDEENRMDDTRKREPDSKGAFKKRIDSGYGKDLGSETEEGHENAATAKEAKKGDQGDISGKQFGLSTTATRHSTDIGNDPEKSKKGEGTPETAKSMGTVSTNRPQV